MSKVKRSLALAATFTMSALIPAYAQGASGYDIAANSELDKLVSFGPDVSQSVQNEVLQTINNSPASIQAALLLDKPSIIVLAGGARDGAAAVFNSSTNQIFVFAGTGMEAEATENELAQIWNLVSNVECNAELQALAVQDIQQNPQALEQIQGILTTGPVLSDGVNFGELFAEAAAGIAGTNQTGVPAFIAKNFPDFYNYLQQLELNGRTTNPTLPDGVVLGYTGNCGGPGGNTTQTAAPLSLPYAVYNLLALNTPGGTTVITSGQWTLGFPQEQPQQFTGTNGAASGAMLPTTSTASVDFDIVDR